METVERPGEAIVGDLDTSLLRRLIPIEVHLTDVQ